MVWIVIMIGMSEPLLASSQCSDHFAFPARRAAPVVRAEGPTALAFRSAVFGGRQRYALLGQLGQSTARVYVSPGFEYIVKHYHHPASRRNVQYEVLISDFFVSKGLAVPEVLDYSSNVFSKTPWARIKDFYVVKRYHPGLNKSERGERNLDKLFEWEFPLLVEKYASHHREFVEWLQNEPRGRQFLEQGLPRPLDIGGDNWILNKQGWMLIDP